MAIIWADGFDDYNTAGILNEYDSGAAAVTSISTGGRRSSNCLFNNGSSSDYVQKQFPSALTEVFVRFAVYWSGPSTYSIGLCSWYSGSTQACSLRVNADGSISAMRGSQLNGTVLGTSAANVCPQNRWVHVEARVVLSTGSSGVVQVRVDGVTTPVLDLSSQNTGAANATALRLHTEYYGCLESYDDLVINDTTGTVANGWMGDVRVDTYLPNANGDLSQMVGSDGDSTNNYALVNASAPGSTYVQGSTVGNEDLYQFADMTHNPATIYGVLATAAALKDDAGTRSIRIHCKSGATDTRSASDIALGTSRVRVGTVFSTDPNTSAAWTKTGLNAAQFGYEVTV